MNINKYPDGTSYASVHPINEFTYKLNSYEDLWHLNQIVNALNNQKITPIITIPNLIDAQADKRFNNNESSGLKLVCNFLNSMQANFKIFHPHNAEIVEALIDNVEIIDNKKFVAEVILDLYPNAVTAQKNCILMAADAGGFKSLMKLCEKLQWKGETASASKARSYENGKTTLHQIVPIEDFNGKDILIIDDICVYGGTFKGLSKILKERNCGKLYLAISHMTVKNLGEDPVTNYFDKVFTTNSKYDNYISKFNENIAIEYNPIVDNLKIIELF